MEQESKSMEIRKGDQPIGYLVLIKTHTEDANATLDYPGRVRELIGEAFDGRALTEEIDYTLEVEHMYVTPDDRYQKQHADHITAMKAAQDAIAVEKRALLNANAALREDAERMRVMRDALESLLQTHCCDTGEPDYRCVWEGEYTICPICIPARAALASTAPVAEVVEPEEIPFTDSCIGCGKKFTEVQICCDEGCTHDGVLHRKGLCEGCCGCEPVAPVAEAGQKEGE